MVEDARLDSLEGVGPVTTKKRVTSSSSLTWLVLTWVSVEDQSFSKITFVS